MQTIFKQLRVKHWVKNLFVFIPLLVSGNLFNYQLILDTFLAFLFFCFASSLIYMVNDLKDLKKDRLHPSKSKRPLANGGLSINLAYLITLVLFIIAVPIQYLVSPSTIFVISGYIILNIIYTYGLKMIPILDITCISIGFVLRVLAGVEAGGLEFSNWLIIMTFSLSMLLALGKRKGELMLDIIEKNKRESLRGYSIDFINNLQVIFCTITLTVYIMYTFFNTRFPADEDLLVYSSLFVILGIARYLQLSSTGKNIETPTDILYKDNFILSTVIAWTSYIGIIAYVL